MPFHIYLLHAQSMVCCVVCKHSSSNHGEHRETASELRLSFTGPRSSLAAPQGPRCRGSFPGLWWPSPRSQAASRRTPGSAGRERALPASAPAGSSPYASQWGRQGHLESTEEDRWSNLMFGRNFNQWDSSHLSKGINIHRLLILIQRSKRKYLHSSFI